jgi:molecular chaperone HscB
MAILNDSAVEPGTPTAVSPPPFVLGADGKVDLDRWSAPGEPQPDAFAVLGLPRRLLLEPSRLDIRFRSLIRDLHPDRFHVAGPDAVRKAERHSSLANDAYRVLRDFERRVRLLLELEGQTVEERFRPSPALLGQLLETNEALDSLQEALADGDPAATNAARTEIEATGRELRDARQALSDRLHDAARRWDAAQAPDAAADLAFLARRDLRAALGEASYLDNLLARVQGALQPPPASTGAQA